MSLVAAAVCPHPPMIVPQVAAGAAAELDELRAACDAAVARLAASPARLLVVVGGDAATREHPVPFHGSFAPWGVPVAVTLGADRPAPAGPTAAGPSAFGPSAGSCAVGSAAGPSAAGPSAAGPAAAGPAAVGPAAVGSAAAGSAVDRPAGHPPAAPLSLLVGAWLVQRALVAGPARRQPAYRLIGVGDPESARQVGATVGAEAPWALLVLGDGSACRGPKSPGYDDPRAEPYDASVARALAGADADALLGLDPVLSAQLRVAGLAPWQVLAAAVRASARPWRGELTYAAAPYGVGYFVAGWEPA